MIKILPFRRLAEASSYMDGAVLKYLNEGQTETFESFQNFNLIAFDWYDIHSDAVSTPQIMVYQDRENLLFFCEDQQAEREVSAIVSELADETDNQQFLYRFFSRLLKGDMAHLEKLELKITDMEDEMLSGFRRAYLDQIIAFRKELMRLKRYYEQLDSIFDELSVNDNGLLREEILRRFVILGSRTERFRGYVLNLREYVAQMREAYQAQIDIQQNDLMKVFTVVTAIFLPLSLLAGWYGMNFRMPELTWKYGYPLVILISVGIVVWLIVYFKRKKWL